MSILMDDPRFINPERIDLKKLNDFNEAKLQEIIAKDPTILGLGDLYAKSREKILPGSGRLDILLSDQDDSERYEVELQLGMTDETHIIRCLEYWDIERRRYPQYEHTAVLVAEDITSRFLNVVSLFNGSIPLIALKLTAFKINDRIILSFTKVLDKVIREEDPSDDEIADRPYWVGRSSEDLVSIIDSTTNSSFQNILMNINPDLKIKYNFQYIGIQENGISNLFSVFTPYKKGYIGVGVRLKREELLENWKKQLQEAGLDADHKRGWLYFKLKTRQELEQYRDLIEKLLKEAYEISNS